MIDSKGFRAGVGIIILNDQNQIFWARRVGKNGWQFPQGGLHEGESAEQAMYRELYEEVGLSISDVKILAESRRWLYYYLPKHLIRQHSQPLCIGQKQKWFLLRLHGEETNIAFDRSHAPEFDSYRWVSYWYPLKQVIFFKRKLYQRALREFSPHVFSTRPNCGI